MRREIGEMYQVGDNVFYGAHGVCMIQDIQELTFSQTPKLYYRLQSQLNKGLILYHPVETDNPKITPVASKQRAHLILELFKNPPNRWTLKVFERAKEHQKILESNNHFEIAQMMNTILRKQIELEREGKKLYAQDLQVLKQVAPILVEELALSLQMTTDEVNLKIEKFLKE